MNVSFTMFIYHDCHSCLVHTKEIKVKDSTKNIFPAALLFKT